MEQPTNLVDKWYEMNPETEDVLPSGRHLIPGMVVLIESPQGRMDLTTWQTWSKADLRNARMWNRWATVAEQPQIVGNGHTISFIAEYEDGSKMQYTTAVQYAWLVKKDSRPDLDKLFTEFMDKVSVVFLGAGSFDELIGRYLHTPGNEEAPKAESKKCSLKSLRDGGDCVFDEGHRFEGLPYCLSRVESEEPLAPKGTEEPTIPNWEQQLKDAPTDVKEFYQGLEDGEQGRV